MSTVFITGISRGIGLGLAREYLAGGHTVVGSVRTHNQMVDTLREAFPERLTVVELDVADRESVDSAVAAVTSTHPVVDILICNAAINPDPAFNVRSLPEIPDEDFLDAFNVNVVGAVRAIRAVYPLLKMAKYPKVVVISSGLASISRARKGSQMPYCVSKAALNMFSRRLHFLLEADDIGVLAVSPGWVKTDMGGPNAMISVEESARSVVSVIERFHRGDPAFQEYNGTPNPW